MTSAGFQWSGSGAKVTTNRDNQEALFVKWFNSAFGALWKVKFPGSTPPCVVATGLVDAAIKADPVLAADIHVLSRLSGTWLVLDFEAVSSAALEAFQYMCKKLHKYKDILPLVVVLGLVATGHTIGVCVYYINLNNV